MFNLFLFPALFLLVLFVDVYFAYCCIATLLTFFCASYKWNNVHLNLSVKFAQYTLRLYVLFAADEYSLTFVINCRTWFALASALGAYLGRFDSHRAAARDQLKRCCPHNSCSCWCSLYSYNYLWARLYAGHDVHITHIIRQWCAYHV